MITLSSRAVQQENSELSGPELSGQPPTGAQPESCLRKAIRYSDLVMLGSRVGRPWFRYTRDGHFMVEVGWEGGGPTTTHCLTELTVIRSNERFACI